MTKKCAKCQLVLDGSDFNWKYKYTRLQSYCKTCSREYIKNHYDNNQKYYIEKAKKRNNFVIKEIHEYIAEYLKSHPCIDCGEKDILVLEFDHRERREKRTEISRIMRMGVRLDKVVKEIEKCDVRCANCHRRKTAKEYSSWKFEYMHP